MWPVTELRCVSVDEFSKIDMSCLLHVTTCMLDDKISRVQFSRLRENGKLVPSKIFIHICIMNP